MFGVKSIVMPEKIDEEAYQSLMKLKEGGENRQKYLDSIKGRLSAEAYKSAVSRLDDVIAHAEELAEKGRVVNRDSWINEKEPSVDRYKGVPVTTINGRKVDLDGEIAMAINIDGCPSLLTRDELDAKIS